MVGPGSKKDWSATIRPKGAAEPVSTRRPDRYWKRSNYFFSRRAGCFFSCASFRVAVCRLRMAMSGLSSAHGPWHGRLSRDAQRRSGEP